MTSWLEVLKTLRDTAHTVAERRGTGAEKALIVEQKIEKRLSLNQRGELKKLMHHWLNEGYRNACADIEAAINMVLDDRVKEKIKPTNPLRLVVDNSREKSGG